MVLQQRGWSIQFYRDARGREPVRDFIASLRGKMLAKVRASVEFLALSGTTIGMPLARPVTGYRFWELRIQAASDSVRIFYFAAGGHRMVLLHAYNKRSRKAPRAELEIAAARMDDYLSR